MVKTAYAIFVAATVAACFVAFPSLAPQVEASAPVMGVKTDRADARPLGAACAQHEWPYFESACMRNPGNPFGEVRQVRVVTADR